MTTERINALLTIERINALIGRLFTNYLLDATAVPIGGRATAYERREGLSLQRISEADYNGIVDDSRPDREGPWH